MAAPNPFQNLIIGLSTGERIFSEGEIGTTMFIVQSGRVRLFRHTAGEVVEIAEMEKGDFFGEMSLLEAVPRNMCAEAIEQTELIEINSTTFDRMIRSNIEVAVRMLRKLSGRLQKAESLLASLRSVPEREETRLPAQAAGTAPPRPVPPATAREPVGAPVLAGAHATQIGAVAPPVGAGAAAPRASTQAPAAGGSLPHAIRPGPQPPTASQPGSLSATRPPSPVMQVPRAAQNQPAPLRTVLPKPATGQGPRLMSESGETIFPLASAEALVGRYDPVTETQPEVDLTLIDIKRSVSRRHARITTKDGTHYLTEEVGALNGTFINGVKLVTGDPKPLKNEDRVSLGNVNLVFRL